ncbi:retrovirus-related pol polyprotein from transposon TNT 1-94 [Tanacetum coccineum]
MRKIISNTSTDSTSQQTRWNKILPSKVNILAWRVLLHRLPTRVNLNHRGIDLDSVRCPLCNDDIETETHVFVNCSLARCIWKVVFSWWQLPNTSITNLDDMFSLPGRVTMESKLKPFSDVPCLYSLFVRAVCAGAIYRTEVCTEVCAGAIYPNKVVSEPGYDKQWQKTALGAVRLSLAKNVAYNVVNEKTTYGLFKALSNMYEKPSASNKVFLIRQLVNTKMNEGASVADHVNEFNSILSRLMSVDIKFDDEVQALLLLSSLPESWSGTVTAVSGSTGSTKLKFDNIRDLIIGEDIRRNIMDSGASFLATYCKEELKRFKLLHWTLEDVRIGMSMLASKGNVPDVWKVDIYFCKPGGLGKQKKLSSIMSEKTRKLQSRSCVRYNAKTFSEVFLKFDNVESIFGVAERLSRTFRAESTRLRAEAPKMLWADSISTTYLIYHIPYILIGLRIPDEEWSVTDSSSLMKPIHKSQVVLVDIPENLAENDSIVAEHGLSSDTSEGSKNSRSFEDSGRSDEEYSEDGASSKEGASETPQVRRYTRESRAPVKYSPSANYLLLTENCKLESYSKALSSKESVQWKKSIIEKCFQLEKNICLFLSQITSRKEASQSLWMFRVKGYQQKRAGYKRCAMDHYHGGGSSKKLRWLFPLVFREEDRCSKSKQVLGYVLTLVTLPKPCQRCPPGGDEKKFEFCAPSTGRAEIPAYRSLLALPFSLVQRFCNFRRYKRSPDVCGAGRPIVVLGLRGGLLGANPIPHSLARGVARGVQFSMGHAVGTGRAVWHETDSLARSL